MSRVKHFKERSESRMVKVTDDWYPCYPNNEVSMTISLWCEKPYEKAGEDKLSYRVRISVWGMDDTGVELDYHYIGQRECAESRYNFWKKYIFDRVPDGVNREWFYEHGFVRA